MMRVGVIVRCEGLSGFFLMCGTFFGEDTLCSVEGGGTDGTFFFRESFLDATSAGPFEATGGTFEAMGVVLRRVAAGDFGSRALADFVDKPDRGALPPVDFFAVCFVLAMFFKWVNCFSNHLQLLTSNRTEGAGCCQ